MKKLLKGKPVAEKILNNIKEYASKNSLKMAIVQIGNDNASTWYRNFKSKKAKKLGIKTEEYLFSKNENQNVIMKKIEELNQDRSITGIFLEQPLPDNFDKNIIVDSIEPLKDIDGITTLNAGKLYLNKNGLFPATAKAIIEILDFYDIKIKGKRVVIIGRSDIVGKPVGFLIMHRHGTITICHSRTENLSEVAREGDILIAAVGKAKMIKNDFVKKNAVVVDAGYNVEGEEVYGDVDLNDVKNKARCITPVPNGVGTVTTSMIFKNLILAHKYQNE